MKKWMFLSLLLVFGFISHTCFGGDHDEDLAENLSSFEARLCTGNVDVSSEVARGLQNVRTPGRNPRARGAEDDDDRARENDVLRGRFESPASDNYPGTFSTPQSSVRLNAHQVGFEQSSPASIVSIPQVRSISEMNARHQTCLIDNAGTLSIMEGTIRNEDTTSGEYNGRWLQILLTDERTAVEKNVSLKVSYNLVVLLDETLSDKAEWEHNDHQYFSLCCRERLAKKIFADRVETRGTNTYKKPKVPHTLHEVRFRMIGEPTLGQDDKPVSARFDLTKLYKRPDSSDNPFPMIVHDINLPVVELKHVCFEPHTNHAEQKISMKFEYEGKNHEENHVWSRSFLYQRAPNITFGVEGWLDVKTEQDKRPPEFTELQTSYLSSRVTIDLSRAIDRPRISPEEATINPEEITKERHIPQPTFSKGAWRIMHSEEVYGGLFPPKFKK